jgi:hypothetical protein
MRFKFDRVKFFTAYRKEFSSLNQQQVDGLNYLLDSIERDPHLTRIEEPAYMLATTKLETAHTFQPIHEYGGRAYFIRNYGGQTGKGRRLGNDTQEEGAIYAGRGDVQLTGENNYEKAEDALRAEYPEIVAEFERRTGRKFDLTVGDQPGDIHDPDNAMDPAIAYAIMSYGMRTGMFTGLGFKSRRFAGLEGKKLYMEWRRIINGTDHAELIADTAMKFGRILRASLITNSAEPAPPIPQREITNDGPAVGGPLTGDGTGTALPPVGDPGTSAETETTAKTEESTPGGTTTEEKKETVFTADTIPQLVPKITSAKTWLGGLGIGGIFSSIAAKAAGMPDWLVFLLGVIAGMVLLGLVFIFWKHIGQVFELAKHAMDKNADKTQNNIQLFGDTERYREAVDARKEDPVKTVRIISD